MKRRINHLMLGTLLTLALVSCDDGADTPFDVVDPRVGMSCSDADPCAPDLHCFESQCEAYCGQDDSVVIRDGAFAFEMDLFEATLDSAGRACSAALAESLAEYNGGLPSVGLTYEEAAYACGRAGKRLCTEQEWRTTCRGVPPNPNNLEGLAGGACNLEGYWVDGVGEYYLCKSQHGVISLFGNAGDRVDGGLVLGGTGLPKWLRSPATWRRFPQRSRRT